MKFIVYDRHTNCFFYFRFLRSFYIDYYIPCGTEYSKIRRTISGRFFGTCTVVPNGLQVSFSYDLNSLGSS